MTFVPNISADYSIEYRIAYLPKEIVLNSNYFANLGVMTFNKSYIHMMFFSKLINALVTLAMFSFFWSGVKKLQKEQLCVEQKYVNQLGLLLFLVNEPISSLSLKLNE